MLFHTEIVKNVYLITDSANGPTENGQSMAPGNPTGNSYLIIGEKVLYFSILQSISLVSMNMLKL